MCLVHVPSYAYGETTINGSGVVHIQNQILHVLCTYFISEHTETNMDIAHFLQIVKDCKQMKMMHILLLI
jgi:hypothetical protein